MTSERKRIANRQNARKSTGPRTAKGKQIASQNAVTHGLLSRGVLLPDEEESTLNTLRADLTAELVPVGAIEEMWVDVIITALWKWRRLNRLEQGMFCYHRKQGLQYERDPLTATEQLAVALVWDANRGDHFGKLARYEVMLERRLVRAFHELERLQAARRGAVAPPPVAVDVTVSGPAGAEFVSSTEMVAADVPSVLRDDAAEPQRAQTGTETPCPTAVEAVDAAALPSEPGAPMDPGAPVDPARNEPTGSREGT